jgi:hypothetical protein
MQMIAATSLPAPFPWAGFPLQASGQGDRLPVPMPKKKKAAKKAAKKAPAKKKK